MTSQDQAKPPVSAQVEPWTSFPELSYAFIDKDYVHDSRAALQVKFTGNRGGIQIKETMNETKTGPHLTDETKFWFSLPKGRSFFASIKTGENIKTHFDNGVSKLFNKDVNLYTTLSFNRQLNHLSLRLGVNHVSENLHSDVRFKINNQEKVDTIISTRNLYTTNKFTWGVIGAFSVGSWILLQNSLLVGYKVDDKNDLYFRTENETFRRNNPESFQDWFSQFILNGVSKINDKTKIGGEIALQAQKHCFKWAQLAVQRVIKDDTVSKFKVKFHPKRVELYAMVNFPIFSKKEDGSVSLGVHGVNLHNKTRQFRWGSKFEFNI